MEIRIGDKVKYKAEFLRSTGQHTGPIPFARGTVRELATLGGTITLATVDWHDPRVPPKVNVKNLRLAGQPEYLNNSRFYRVKLGSEKTTVCPRCSRVNDHATGNTCSHVAKVTVKGIVFYYSDQPETNPKRRRVFRKTFAAVPSERRKTCPHTHMPYSGRIPCTGVRRCTMCGATADEIRRAHKNPNRGEKRYMCYTCGGVTFYATPKEAAKIRRQGHKIKEFPRPSTPNPICGRCGRSMGSWTAYKAHIKTCRGQTRRNPCGTRNNPYCVKCGRKYRGKGFQGMCPFCVREGANPCGIRKNPFTGPERDRLEKLYREADVHAKWGRFYASRRSDEVLVRREARAYNDRVALLRAIVGNATVDRMERTWLLGPDRWKEAVGEEWLGVVQTAAAGRVGGNASNCNPATCMNPAHKHYRKNNATVLLGMMVLKELHNKNRGKTRFPVRVVPIKKKHHK